LAFDLKSYVDADPSQVAAGPGQTRDHPLEYRARHDGNDRYCAGFRYQIRYQITGQTDDDIRGALHHPVCQIRITLDMPFGGEVLSLEIYSLDITKAAQLWEQRAIDRKVAPFVRSRGRVGDHDPI